MSGPSAESICSSLAQGVVSALCLVPDRFIDKVSMVHEIEQILLKMRESLIQYGKSVTAKEFLQFQMYTGNFEAEIYEICGSDNVASESAIEKLYLLLHEWKMSFCPAG